ncbi:MAG: tyrosine-protein phosphatase [Clostridia bacterium]|nr:tyrosine-protein phosphatase [Clostridia bacterium]
MKKTVTFSRLTAVVLTLAMLLSFAAALPASAAVAESFDGYIHNGDFETGAAGSWSLSSGASIVSGGHDGSGYCVRVSGGKWSSSYQDVTVKADTNYRLSGWVRRVSGTGAHHFYAQNLSHENCARLNGTQTWFTYSYDGWIQHVLDFNTGSDTIVRILMTVEDPESVFLYDDLLLEELPDENTDGKIRNGGFDTGISGGWLINSLSSFTKTGMNDSAYCLKITGNAGQNVRQSIRVKGRTDYRLTVYSKRARGSGSQKIYVQRGDTLIEPINDTDGIINETERVWIEHVYDFNSGPASQITVFIEVVDTGASFYYDDITLEEITGPVYDDVLKGDLTLDGVIDRDDSALMDSFIAGEAQLEDRALYAADMDCSGTVDAADAALLGEYLNTGVAALYPIRGETVAKASWQVAALFDDDYEPGMTDAYSNVAARKDQYMRDDVVLRWISEIPQRSYTVLVADNPQLRNAKTYLAQEESLTLQNLFVDTDYYWAVDAGGTRSAVGRFHTENTVRTLWIEGVSNTRDIGGWLTEDGTMRVKYNVAFRGARFDQITDAGRAAVADLGLKTDVDLRTQNEGVQAPLGDLAEWFLAGKNGAAMYYTEDASSISDLTSNYVKATVNAISVYANSSKFPAYFHCSYGRDRTGTMGFLLLGLLGVSRVDIQKDYEMTFLSEFGGGGISASGHLAQLNKTIDWVVENYGQGKTLQSAVEGYLSAAGMSAETMTAIRANLLEPVDEAEPVMTGIAVTVLPKWQYEEGDEFDPTGMEVVAYYDDGTQAVLTAEEYVISGFESTVGEHTITVSVGEFSDTFAVNVSRKLTPGDPDGDGVITVSDALAALRIAAKLAEETPAMLTCCDVDGDGEITVADALEILRVAVGLKDAF